MATLAQQIDFLRTRGSEMRTVLLPDTCSVTRGVTVTNTESGYTETPNVVGTNISCKYESRSAFEQAAAGTVVASGTHTLIFPAGTDIRPQDKVTVNARGTTAALGFQITGALPDSFDLMLRVAANLEG